MGLKHRSANGEWNKCEAQEGRCPIAAASPVGNATHVPDDIDSETAEAMYQAAMKTNTDRKLSKKSAPVAETSTMKMLPNGDAEWRNSAGELHRNDGPAIERLDGSYEYYQHGKLHRTDGPAKVTPEVVEFYENGQLHRLDGPAVETVNGERYFYIDGKNIPGDVHWRENKKRTGRDRTDAPAIHGRKYYSYEGMENRYNQLAIENIRVGGSDGRMTEMNELRDVMDAYRAAQGKVMTKPEPSEKLKDRYPELATPYVKSPDESSIIAKPLPLPTRGMEFSFYGAHGLDSYNMADKVKSVRQSLKEASAAGELPKDLKYTVANGMGSRTRITVSKKDGSPLDDDFLARTVDPARADDENFGRWDKVATNTKGSRVVTDKAEQLKEYLSALGNQYGYRADDEEYGMTDVVFKSNPGPEVSGLITDNHF